MIPQSFIQELLNRVDIVDVVERYVPLKKAGANLTACCPFHSEKSPSFTVSPTKQFYHCFGCGAHGSAISFLMEHQGMSFPDAVEELARAAGLTVPQENNHTATPRVDIAPLTEVMARAARLYRDQLKQSPKAIEYLKSRGLTGEVAARFGLGYAPDGWQNLQAIFPDYQAHTLLEAGLVIDSEEGRRYDRFRDRVMFPILDQRGNVIGFGGRVIGPGEPKYLNSPETPLFEKGRELYGLTQARNEIRATDTVIVVEGYMDVVALAQFGVNNAVATLGTATTGTHIQKLFRQAERVVFCFDGDKAGRKAAWRALEASLEHLVDSKTVSFLFLPPEHDPDSFIRANGCDAFREAARSATSLTQFLLNELLSRTDTNTAEGRAHLVHEAKPLVTRVAAPLLRLQIVKALTGPSGLTQAELEAAMGLKPITPPGKAAPRATPRRPPSPLTRKLLMMLAHRPDLAERVPLDLLPDDADNTESAALRALHQAQRESPFPAGALGQVMERFRGSPHQDVFAELIGEIEENYFDAESLEVVFNDTLERLRRAAREKEFAALNEKVTKGGLSPEDLTRYRQLLLQKQQIKTEVSETDL